jgi:hypothetical protein
MVTDPPYGVEYDPEWRHRLGVKKSNKRGKVMNDERPDWAEAWAPCRGNRVCHMRPRIHRKECSWDGTDP